MATRTLLWWSTTALVRGYLFVYRRHRGRIAAVAQRQSNRASPTFTGEEGPRIYVFGLIKKRSTPGEIHRYAEDHFSDWVPDFRTQERYNRCPGRLAAAVAFLPALWQWLEDRGFWGER